MHLMPPSQPVGLPGLAIMFVGALLFFATMVRMRRGAGGGAPATRRSRASVAGVLLQMLGFASVGMGPILATLPPAAPRALLQAAIVAALMGGSVLLFVAATRAMGANWSVVARMRSGHELVTSGIFARMRHPIYAGMALFLAALAVAFGHLPNLVVGVPLFLIGTWIRVREEERLLNAEFGPAYSDYAARVKRFVPGII
jgi:protein-S-isoprenylcysteine O-methyltransferase Ste14